MSNNSGHSANEDRLEGRVLSNWVDLAVLSAAEEYRIGVDDCVNPDLLSQPAHTDPRVGWFCLVLKRQGELSIGKTWSKINGGRQSDPPSLTRSLRYEITDGAASTSSVALCADRFCGQRFDLDRR
jgi:hypothetical protein